MHSIKSLLIELCDELNKSLSTHVNTGRAEKVSALERLKDEISAYTASNAMRPYAVYFYISRIASCCLYARGSLWRIITKTRTGVKLMQLLNSPQYVGLRPARKLDVSYQSLLHLAHKPQKFITRVEHAYGL